MKSRTTCFKNASDLIDEMNWQMRRDLSRLKK